MAGNSAFKENIEALINGTESYMNTKTVVGEAISVGENMVLPLADISFGLGAGTFGSAEQNNSGGGMGVKITPTAVLVVNSNSAKILTLKDNPGLLEKILEIAPGIISKFTKKAPDDSPSGKDDIF